MCVQKYCRHPDVLTLDLDLRSIFPQLQLAATNIVGEKRGVLFVCLNS